MIKKKKEKHTIVNDEEKEGEIRYQAMEEDQDGNGRNGIDASDIKGGAVIGKNQSIVSNADNTKDKEDHNRAKAAERRAELEHVPSHHSTRSVHDFHGKTGKVSIFLHRSINLLRF